MANNVNPQIDFQHKKWPKKATHKNSFKHFNIQNRISIDRKFNSGNQQKIQHTKSPTMATHKFQYKTATLGNEQIKFQHTKWLLLSNHK